MSNSDYLKRPDVQPYLRVRAALQKWDPIGVSDISEDEYDGYIPQLIRLLDQGAGAEYLTDFLVTLVHDNMGLEANLAQTKEIAKNLVIYWKTLDK
jgi:hypothetical protein